MNIVIIEDEKLAANHLERMIHRYDPSIHVLAIIASVEQAVQYFQENPSPDLIFLDIHLEDNLSFKIFENTEVQAPIIFTTAFDEYAIRAFKLKSIDYLLKPIIQSELEAALRKYKEWNQLTPVDVNAIYKSLIQEKPTYRKRFSIQIGNKLKTFLVNEVAYFYSSENITFVVLTDKSEYPVDQSLDTLSSQLDPHDFFRINRQYLISLNSIHNVMVYPKRRLKVELNPPAGNEIFVSIDRITGFKDWLDS